MGSLEGMFVVTEIIGVDISRSFAFWGGVLGIPFVAAAAAVTYERGRHAAREPAAWGQWALVGAGMFILWAGLYFLVGRVPQPASVIYFSSAFESHIPLRPAFSLLYLLLYPIFLLPFFVIRERPVLQRLVAADFIMFALCSVLFVAFPVGMERPSLPPPTSLGSWVLGMVWGNDVAWNCMPSEHCMAAMIASLAMWDSNRRAGAFGFLSALLIGISTLFTKQHYLVDVIAGYGLAFGVYGALRWAKSFEPMAAAEAPTSER